MEERLRLYQRRKRLLPHQIIVYHDGLSEGQFNVVIDEEYLQMLEAFNALGNPEQPYRPQLTIVICRKRHQVRAPQVDLQFMDQSGGLDLRPIVNRGVTDVHSKYGFGKLFTDLMDSLDRFRLFPSGTQWSLRHNPSYALLCHP